jgi:hypothetical protein
MTDASFLDASAAPSIDLGPVGGFNPDQGTSRDLYIPVSERQRISQQQQQQAQTSMHAQVPPRSASPYQAPPPSDGSFHGTQNEGSSQGTMGASGANAYGHAPPRSGPSASALPPPLLASLGTEYSYMSGGVSFLMYPGEGGTPRSGPRSDITDYPAVPLPDGSSGTGSKHSGIQRQLSDSMQNVSMHRLAESPLSYGGASGASGPHAYQAMRGSMSASNVFVPTDVVGSPTATNSRPGTCHLRSVSMSNISDGLSGAPVAPSNNRSLEPPPRPSNPLPPCLRTARSERGILPLLPRDCLFDLVLIRERSEVSSIGELERVLSHKLLCLVTSRLPKEPLLLHYFPSSDSKRLIVCCGKLTKLTTCLVVSLLSIPHVSW